jgi:hypothetical protein
LVEIDCLVAVWLGVEVDDLVTIYRSRFPVLFGYETDTYFDSMGRQIGRRRKGHLQSASVWRELIDHLEHPKRVAAPSGYDAPFYKADREAEYRQAHAVFSERLRRAEEAGWSLS